ncbi:winged helix-turn-helix transcriptional regulator [Vibrio harveyi]|uniref:winged helix-turn-helix transcriptional regulator n=1 Tax=Vibrio harveyi TaxID=669 RepID=UPI0018F127AD|nr:winged helix-turn-helix transcriptional regulator [Vibrio harveyi]
MLIKLLDFTQDEHPNGNVKGKKVFNDLKSFVDNHLEVGTFVVSLKGIIATDASFPRESVISLASFYRGEKYFCLTDIDDDQDLMDNWTYAAAAKDQPITVWSSGVVQFIGPDMTKSEKELLELLKAKGKVATSEVSKELDISSQNASTRLKNIFKKGYVQRVEEVAESGGKEFIYKLVGKSG